MKLLFKRLVAGLIVMVVGLPISYIGMKISKEQKLPPLKSWIGIALSLFITGVISQLLLQYV